MSINLEPIRVYQCPLLCSWTATTKKVVKKHLQEHDEKAKEFCGCKTDEAGIDHRGYDHFINEHLGI